MASQWEHIKWIPGTRLMVDGFRFQNASCKSYLLTHFHSDHTTGLAKSFNAGLIFCTAITARLLRKDMGMPPERICELEMDKPKLIEGAEVTPIDANHCPGACMFLIKTKATSDRKAQTILHTGDLRWSSQMAHHAALRDQRIDYLFLDTTYAKPAHTHPPQDICIDTMVKIMKEEAARNPRTLFVCGSYHIGKERAYLGAAKLLGWKVWCDANKRRVLKMLDLPDELMLLLCTKPKDARIHVDFLGGLQPERLQQRINPCGSWTHVVAFRPTGWTYRRSGKQDVRQEGNVKIYGVPYSEHSSFPELRDCVSQLRPLKLVPTVNATNHTAAEAIISRFADLMDLSEDRSRLDFFMRKRQKLEACEEDMYEAPSVKSETLPDLPDLGCGAVYRDPEDPEAVHRAASLPCKPEEAWQRDSYIKHEAAEGGGLGQHPSAESDGGQSGLYTPEPARGAEAWTNQESFQEPKSPKYSSSVKLKAEQSDRGQANCQAIGGASVRENPEAPADDCPDHHHSVKLEPVEGPRAQPLQLLTEAKPLVPGFRRSLQGPSLSYHEPQLAANPSFATPGPFSKDRSLHSEPSTDASGGGEMLSSRPQESPDPSLQEARGTGCAGPGRADSNESCTEHFDMAAIDVSEQEKILQAIVADREKMGLDIARSLSKTRQSSMAAFLRR